MTQPPLPPQMPPEPLDELPLNEQERVIARALRNLPVGAPPPELDARILGAARRSVHLSPPRKNNQRRWLVGFGTAASALLAIGLFVKTHGPGEGAVFTPPAETTTSESVNAPAAASTTATKQQAESQTAADAIAPAGNAAAAQSGVTSGEVLSQESERAQQAVGSLSAAKSAPQAFPSVVEPPPPPRKLLPPPRMQAPTPIPSVVMEETAPTSMPAPPAPPPPPMQTVDERQERKAEQDLATRRDAAAAAPAVAPASPAAVGGAALDQPALGKITSNALKSNAPASDQGASGFAHATDAYIDASKDKSLDRVEVGGSRAKRAKDEGALLPSIDDDAKLAPAQWIERIRARVDAADGDDARESLRRFRVRYPDAGIPDDLMPLLH